MDSDGFRQIQTDSNRFKQIQTDSDRFRQIQTDSDRFRQIQTDSNRFKQSQTDSDKLKHLPHRKTIGSCFMIILLNFITWQLYESTSGPAALKLVTKQFLI